MYPAFQPGLSPVLASKCQPPRCLVVLVRVFSRTRRNEATLTSALLSLSQFFSGQDKETASPASGWQLLSVYAYSIGEYRRYYILHFLSVCRGASSGRGDDEVDFA